MTASPLTAKSLTNSNTDYACDTRLHTRLQFSATLTMLNESLGTCLAV